MESSKDSQSAHSIGELLFDQKNDSFALPLSNGTIAYFQKTGDQAPEMAPHKLHKHDSYQTRVTNEANIEQKPDSKKVSSLNFNKTRDTFEMLRFVDKDLKKLFKLSPTGMGVYNPITGQKAVSTFKTSTPRTVTVCLDLNAQQVMFWLNDRKMSNKRIQLPKVDGCMSGPWIPCVTLDKERNKVVLNPYARVPKDYYEQEREKIIEDQDFYIPQFHNTILVSQLDYKLLQNSMNGRALNGVQICSMKNQTEKAEQVEDTHPDGILIAGVLGWGQFDQAENDENEHIISKAFLHFNKTDEFCSFVKAMIQKNKKSDIIFQDTLAKAMSNENLIPPQLRGFYKLFVNKITQIAPKSTFQDALNTVEQTFDLLSAKQQPSQQNETVINAIMHEFSDKVIMVKDKKDYCLLTRESTGDQEFDFEQARFNRVPQSFKESVSFILKPELLDHFMYFLSWSLILKKDDSTSAIYNGIINQVFTSISQTLSYTHSQNNVTFECPILEMKMFLDQCQSKTKEVLKKMKSSLDVQMNEHQLQQLNRKPLLLLPALEGVKFCVQDPNQSPDDFNLVLQIIVDLQEQIWMQTRSDRCPGQIKTFLMRTARPNSAFGRMQSLSLIGFDSSTYSKLANEGFFQKESVALGISGETQAEVPHILKSDPLNQAQSLVGKQRMNEGLPCENVELSKSLNYASHIKSHEKFEEVIVSPNSEFVLLTRKNGKVTLGAITETFSEQKVIRLAQPFSSANSTTFRERNQKLLQGFKDQLNFSKQIEIKAQGPAIKQDFQNQPFKIIVPSKKSEPFGSKKSSLKETAKSKLTAKKKQIKKGSVKQKLKSIEEQSNAQTIEEDEKSNSELKEPEEKTSTQAKEEDSKTQEKATGAYPGVVLHTFMLSRPANDHSFDPVIVGAVIQNTQTKKLFLHVRKLCFQLTFLSALLSYDLHSGQHYNTLTNEYLTPEEGLKKGDDSESLEEEILKSFLLNILKERSAILDHAQISTRLKPSGGKEQMISKNDYKSKSLIDIAASEIELCNAESVIDCIKTSYQVEMSNNISLLVEKKDGIKSLLCVKVNSNGLSDLALSLEHEKILMDLQAPARIVQTQNMIHILHSDKLLSFEIKESSLTQQQEQNLPQQVDQEALKSCIIHNSSKAENKFEHSSYSSFGIKNCSEQSWTLSFKENDKIFSIELPKTLESQISKENEPKVDFQMSKELTKEEALQQFAQTSSLSSLDSFSKMLQVQQVCLKAFKSNNTFLQVGQVNQFSSYPQKCYWHNLRQNSLPQIVEIGFRKEDIINLKNLQLELSFVKTTKEPLPIVHLQKTIKSDFIKSDRSEKLPLQVVFNTGATTSELYQPTIMVTPNDETFSSNYGAPEFIFSHIDNKSFVIDKVTLRSAINKTNKGFPISEGLVFVSDSLEDLIQAKHFNNFSKANYMKWLEKKGDSPVQPFEPICFIDIDGELEGTQTIEQQTNPAKFVKFVPRNFRKKPINYQAQANFSQQGSEFQFFGIEGAIVDDLSNAKADSQGESVDIQIKGTVLQSDQQIAQFDQVKIDHLRNPKNSLVQLPLAPLFSQTHQSKSLIGVSSINVDLTGKTVQTDLKLKIKLEAPSSEFFKLSGIGVKAFKYNSSTNSENPLLDLKLREIVMDQTQKGVIQETLLKIIDQSSQKIKTIINEEKEQALIKEELQKIAFVLKQLNTQATEINYMGLLKIFENLGKVQQLEKADKAALNCFSNELISFFNASKFSENVVKDYEVIVQTHLVSLLQEQNLTANCQSILFKCLKLCSKTFFQQVLNQLLQHSFKKLEVLQTTEYLALRAKQQLNEFPFDPNFDQNAKSGLKDLDSRANGISLDFTMQKQHSCYHLYIDLKKHCILDKLYLSFGLTTTLHKVAIRVYGLKGSLQDESIIEDLVCYKNFDEASYTQVAEKAVIQQEYFGQNKALNSLITPLGQYKSRYLKVQFDLQDSHKTVHGLKGQKGQQMVSNIVPHVEGELIATDDENGFVQSIESRYFNSQQLKEKENYQEIDFVSENGVEYKAGTIDAKSLKTGFVYFVSQQQSTKLLRPLTEEELQQVEQKRQGIRKTLTEIEPEEDDNLNSKIFGLSGQVKALMNDLSGKEPVKHEGQCLSFIFGLLSQVCLLLMSEINESAKDQTEYKPIMTYEEIYNKLLLHCVAQDIQNCHLVELQFMDLILTKIPDKAHFICGIWEEIIFKRQMGNETTQQLIIKFMRTQVKMRPSDIIQQLTDIAFQVPKERKEESLDTLLRKPPMPSEKLSTNIFLVTLDIVDDLIQESKDQQKELECATFVRLVAYFLESASFKKALASQIIPFAIKILSKFVQQSSNEQKEKINKTELAILYQACLHLGDQAQLEAFWAILIEVCLGSTVQLENVIKIFLESSDLIKQQINPSSQLVPFKARYVRFESNSNEYPICKLGHNVSSLKSFKSYFSKLKDESLQQKANNSINDSLLLMLNTFENSGDAKPIQQVSGLMFDIIGSLDAEQREETELIPKLANMFYKMNPVDQESSYPKILKDVGLIKEKRNLVISLLFTAYNRMNPDQYSRDEQNISFRICDGLLKIMIGHSEQGQVKLSPVEFQAWFKVFSEFLISHVNQGVFTGAVGANDLQLARLSISTQILHLITESKTTEQTSEEVKQKEIVKKNELLSKENSALLHFIFSQSAEEHKHSLEIEQLISWLFLNNTEKAGNAPSGAAAHKLSTTILKILASCGASEKVSEVLTPKLLNAITFIDQMVRDQLENDKSNSERIINLQKNVNSILLVLFEAWVQNDNIAKKFLTDMDGFNFMLNRLFDEGQGSTSKKTPHKSDSKKKRKFEDSEDSDEDSNSIQLGKSVLSKLAGKQLSPDPKQKTPVNPVQTEIPQVQPQMPVINALSSVYAQTQNLQAIPPVDSLANFGQPPPFGILPQDVVPSEFTQNMNLFGIPPPSNIYPQYNDPSLGAPPQFFNDTPNPFATQNHPVTPVSFLSPKQTQKPSTQPLVDSQSSNSSEIEKALKVDDFGKNMKLIEMNDKSNVANYANIVWNKHKALTNQKQRIFNKPLSDKSLYQEFTMEFELKEEAEIQQIEVGLFIHWTTYDADQNYEPLRFTVEGGLTRGKKDWTAILKKIDDHQSCVYLANFITSKAAQLHENPWESIESMAEEAVTSIKKVKAKYITFKFRLPLQAYMETSTFASGASKARSYGISYFSVNGNVIKSNQLARKYAIELQRENSLNLLSKFFQGSFTESFKMISHKEQSIEKFKIMFDRMIGLLFKKADVIKPIFLALCSNNEEMGTWIIEHRLLKPNTSKEGIKFLSDIVSAQPELMLSRLETIKTFIFSQLAEFSKTASLNQFQTIFTLIKTYCKKAREFAALTVSEKGNQAEEIRLNFKVDDLNQCIQFMTRCEGKELNIVTKLCILLLIPPVPFVNKTIQPAELVEQITKDSDLETNESKIFMASIISSTNTEALMKLIPIFESQIFSTIFTDILAKKETEENQEQDELDKAVQPDQEQEQTKQAEKPKSPTSKMMTTSPDQHYDAYVDLDEQTQEEDYITIQSMMNNDIIEKEEDKSKPVKAEEKKEDPKAKKILRKVFALYNCCKQSEFQEYLKKYVFQLYDLTYSDPFFYKESNILVQLIKEIINGDGQLEQDMAKVLKDNMSKYSKQKRVDFINKVVLPILHAEKDASVTFSMKNSSGKTVPIYSSGTSKDARSNFFLKTDLLNDKQKDAFMNTFNDQQQNQNPEFQQLISSKWEKIFEDKLPNVNPGTFREFVNAVQKKANTIHLVSCSINGTKALFGGYCSKAFPVLGEKWTMEYDYQIAHSPQNFVFYYTDDKELHFVMTHQKPFGFIYTDYEDGGALSVSGDFFLISWSHEFQHSCGNLYDMKCLEDQSLGAFYNNMQIETYEVWHCELGVQDEIDGSKFKNELKKSELYNNYTPLQYFRDNLVFQIPTEMNLRQAAEKLGFNIEEFNDTAGNKLDPERALGLIGADRDGIVDLICKPKEDSKKEDQKGKKAVAAAPKASTGPEYKPNMKILKLFEEFGGIMDTIDAAKCAVQLYKSKKYKEMWTLWLQELEQFSKLPQFFNIFSNDRSKEEIIYKLLSGQLDEDEPEEEKEQVKNPKSKKPQKKKAKQNNNKMSPCETLHIDLVKYCYDIVAQVFERASNDYKLREESIQNGTLEKFIERIGFLTNEKKRVKVVKTKEGNTESITLKPSTSSVPATLPKMEKTSGSKKLAKSGIGYAPNGSNSVEVWNVSEYLKNKEAMNSQVANLLQILREVIHCEGWKVPDEVQSLFLESSLLPSIEAALRSGSLLEMAKEEKMNTNYLLLVKEIARHEELMMSILVDIGDDYEPRQKTPICDLLSQLAEQNELFLSCLTTSAAGQEDAKDQSSRRLALQIKETNEYVQEALKKKSLNKVKDDIQQILEQPLEVAYEKLISPLKLETVDMSTKSGSSVSYKNHCYNADLAQKMNAPQSKLVRLAQEIADLYNSLPCDPTNAIFIRVDKKHVDLLKIIILGSSGTPYAHGAFEFDMYCDNTYPQSPPKCTLKTTGGATVRFNPNLYSNGKVCLSLLGTWRGSATENWDAKISTILQVLISIQAIIMSTEVYFNEPGYEHEQGTPAGDKKNEGYSNIVRYCNVKFAILDQIKNPPAGFETVVRRAMYLKKNIILQEVADWVKLAKKSDANYTSLVNDHNISWAKTFSAKGKYADMMLEVYTELQKVFADMESPFADDTGKKLTRKFSDPFAASGIKPALAQIKATSSNVKGAGVAQVSDIDMTYDEVDESKEKEENSESTIDIKDDKVKDRWSRYIGAMGIEAVAQQAQATIILLGLGSVGIEIAKNIVLAGCKEFIIVDDSLPSLKDLQTQFYITKEDIEKNKTRAECCKHKLKQLNSYVKVTVSTLDPVSLIKKCDNSLKVVIKEDLLLPVSSEKINQACRDKGVAFMEVYTSGLYAKIFNDFGPEFLVKDPNGEAMIDYPIESIVEEEVKDKDQQNETSEISHIVSLVKGFKHKLADGDYIQISSKHLESLKDKEFKVLTKSPVSYQINIPKELCPIKLEGDAEMKQVKKPLLLKFKPIQECQSEMENPVLDEDLQIHDFAKMDHQRSMHACFSLIPKMTEGCGQIWNKKEAETHVQKVIELLKPENEDDKKKIQLFASVFFMMLDTSFAPFSAFIGGVASQEIIKFLTFKFKPIHQVAYFDVTELLPEEVDFTNQESINKYFNPSDLQQPELRFILGKKTEELLQNTNLFMIGAGAIGCELLKNFAMLGVGTGDKGSIVLTDPDIIEVSNLNRQFLFREKHLRKPKSQVAAAAVVQMNPSLSGHIFPRLDKIHPGTDKIYSESFFQEQNIVCNALDNVTARLYIDAQCVKARVPLIDSGTLGPKGHVQVVQPNVTESYGSQLDPEDNTEIPHCTLKMFPEETLHCVEWAKDIFGSTFSLAPQALNKILTEDEINFLDTQERGKFKEACKLLENKPKDFSQCIITARKIFQDSFNYNIHQLMHIYPLDKKDKDGKLFWSLPKRPPKAVDFNKDDELHQDMIAAYACLIATMYAVKIPHENPRDRDAKAKMALLASEQDVKPFEVDEGAIKEIESLVEKQGADKNEESSKEEESKGTSSPDEEKEAKDLYEKHIKPIKDVPDKISYNLLFVQEFEKDEDSNFHIDLIYSFANLRARNYNLEPMDWLQVKLKAGRIVPALATTTAAIAGLQTIEMIKLILGLKSDKLRNAFLNLAVPSLMLAEPGDAQSTEIKKDLKVNLWTRWEVKGFGRWTNLSQVFKYIKDQYGLDCRDVLYGSTSLLMYVMIQILPEEQRISELRKPICQLLDMGDQTPEYVDLTITMVDPEAELVDGKEKTIEAAPIVRVYLTENATVEIDIPKGAIPNLFGDSSEDSQSDKEKNDDEGEWEDY